MRIEQAQKDADSQGRPIHELGVLDRFHVHDFAVGGGQQQRIILRHIPVRVAEEQQGPRQDNRQDRLYEGNRPCREDRRPEQCEDHHNNGEACRIDDYLRQSVSGQWNSHNPL